MSRRCTLSGCWLLVPMVFIFGCQGQGTFSSGGVNAADIDPTLPVIPDSAVSRAITWENRTGAVGVGGMSKSGLGTGRKGSPCIPEVKNGETVTLMDIDGCGVIRHIWITIPDRSPEAMRNMILRMYWDGSEVPSVEVPLGDFFGVAHGQCRVLTTAYVTQVLGRGFNSYFAMPFGTHAKITVTNDMPDGKKMGAFFYQIDYELRDKLPANTGRFHAQFRRENPTVMKRDYVILDNVEGPGCFIGCVIGVRALGPHWWGEGEMKFYMDGDTDYPTICGTGTEDYFCGSYGFHARTADGTTEYREYTTPYAGMPQVIRPDGLNDSQQRFGLYRWHVMDPVRFDSDLKVTMQALGWRWGGRYLPLKDDIASVAYWYQAEPHAAFPKLPDKDGLEVN